MNRFRTATRPRARAGVALAAAALALALAITTATTSAAPVRATTGAKHWSGTGNRLLGTVKVTKDSVVKWTSSGKSFSLTDRSGKLKISGKAKSGASFAVRKTYRVVRVRAKGRWTLSMTPLPAPKKK